tara:strand:+ start:827 stop:1075 length:249 start_codon:yes stop_codon:yes gene_type:complete
MSIDIKMKCRCGGEMSVTGLDKPTDSDSVISEFNEEHQNCLKKKDLVINDGTTWISGREQERIARGEMWVPKEQVDKDKENE